MVAILALVLCGQLEQPIHITLPHIAKKITVEIKGEISNSSDPYLTIPYKLFLMPETSSHDHLIKSTVDNGFCHINNRMEINGPDVWILLKHYHSGYQHLDFIGSLHYKVWYDEECLEGDYKLEQRPGRENNQQFILKKFLISENVYEPIEFFGETENYCSNFSVKVIPHRRYKVVFDYILEDNKNATTNFIITKVYNINGYKIERTTYRLQEKLDFLKRKAWNKFDQIIATSSCCDELGFSWKITHNNSGEPSILIKNAWLIPLSNPREENSGP